MSTSHNPPPLSETFIIKAFVCVCFDCKYDVCLLGTHLQQGTWLMRAGKNGIERKSCIADMLKQTNKNIRHEMNCWQQIIHSCPVVLHDVDTADL